jgi:hypothetical protein
LPFVLVGIAVAVVAVLVVIGVYLLVRRWL